MNLKFYRSRLLYSIFIKKYLKIFFWQLSKFSVKMSIEDSTLDLYDSNKYSTAEKCKICYMKFLDEEKICILLCQHIYHQSCLNVYIQSVPACPQCHTEVKDIKKSQSLMESDGNRRARSLSRRRRRRSRSRTASRGPVYVPVKPLVSGSPTRHMRYQKLDIELWGRESSAGPPESIFDVMC